MGSLVFSHRGFVVFGYIRAGFSPIGVAPNFTQGKNDLVYPVQLVPQKSALRRALLIKGIDHLTAFGLFGFLESGIYPGL